MVRSFLPARGAVAIVVLVLFLGCTGLSLFCPMTAAAPAGSSDAATHHDSGHGADAAKRCPDSLSAWSSSWDPQQASAPVLCDHATGRRTAGLRSPDRVDTVSVDRGGPPRYLFLTTWRL